MYIHEKDAEWVQNKNGYLKLWQGDEQVLWDGIRIIHIGGHFPGSSILHLPALSPGGAVFCGDTMVISPSKQHVSVMYSYPNRIPLPIREVKRIRNKLELITFDALYSFLHDLDITENLSEILRKSMDRYV